MWDKLPKEGKKIYKQLITNFASLSEAFSQKSDEEAKEIVAPIVNSKFQEAAFQKAFAATGEDIANTAFDVSVQVDDKHKYLVGIKTFGIASGDQKIAQFKASAEADNWNETLTQIKKNAEQAPNKEKADEWNKHLYLELAKKITKIRNERIESAKAQIKGFDAYGEEVESVYHVLMPSKKGNKPQISVGETGYHLIDEEQIEIEGATNLKNPTNFKFKDSHHVYKYTAADSQLYMAFDKEEMELERWNVEYLQNPFHFFKNLHHLVKEVSSKKPAVEATVSWLINIEKYSGFNQFNGVGLKSLKKKRPKMLKDIAPVLRSVVTPEDFTFIYDRLRLLLLNENRELEKLIVKYKERSDEVREFKYLKREELMRKIESLSNPALTKKITGLVFRPVDEMYIPISHARNFHDNNPDFFGKNIGTFKEGKDKRKLALKNEDRVFRLKFLPSGKTMEAYICQDNGKGIQSIKKQSILGNWILREVFQLKNREVLTEKKLIDLGINGIRLHKFNEKAEDGKSVIGLEFIWIDEANLPRDFIGSD